MRMKIKVISVIIAIVMLVGILGGCETDSDNVDYSKGFNTIEEAIASMERNEGVEGISVIDVIKMDKSCYVSYEYERENWITVLYFDEQYYLLKYPGSVKVLSNESYFASVIITKIKGNFIIQLGFSKDSKTFDIIDSLGNKYQYLETEKMTIYVAVVDEMPKDYIIYVEGEPSVIE